VLALVADDAAQQTAPVFTGSFDEKRDTEGFHQERPNAQKVAFLWTKLG